MNVLLGVSGGIAAYKAAALTSTLIKAGHQVRVVMTENAARFVGPITFEALSQHSVMTNALATGAAGEHVASIEHIEWAKWAEVVVVAPLTANTLAKIACGIADDALGTVLMAIPQGVPVVLCPAMNTAMWEHPVVRRNLGWIADLGRYKIVLPVHKRLACGDVGVGGLANVSDIIEAIEGPQLS
jgi:phosphopantothenoylcysteine decarboxylase / phosphopantothenate---cysteine ligase